jgi:cytochrome oxidase Cu insertion factor (SCO1/SenC/PrrC family)
MLFTGSKALRETRVSGRFVRRLPMLAAVWVCLSAQAPPAQAQFAAARLQYASAAPWNDDNGRVLKLGELKGSPIIVTMAYTACRKTCSTTLLSLQELQRIADRRGLNASFVIVSYDPEQDSPALWREYRKQRRIDRDNWHFLTGSSLETRRIARFLDLEYWSYDEHIMHDFRVVMFDADGRYLRDLRWRDRGRLEEFLAPG